MMFGILVLIDSRIREVRQSVDTDSSATILDTLRNVCRRKISPSNHPWTFMMEVPIDIGDRGIVFYQKWKTEVSL